MHRITSRIINKITLANLYTLDISIIIISNTIERENEIEKKMIKISITLAKIPYNPVHMQKHFVHIPQTTNNDM